LFETNLVLIAWCTIAILIWGGISGFNLIEYTPKADFELLFNREFFTREP